MSKLENIDFMEDEAVSSDIQPDDEGTNGLRQRLKKRKKLVITLGIIGAIILMLVVNAVVKAVRNSGDSGPQYKDAEVERRTISNTITGSSSIEPNDSYNVMTIKSGDINADYFKEGDTVKKGDKLYQFDDEDARKSLITAKNAVTKAQLSLNDARDTSDKQYVKSDIAGKVKEVYVSVGDNVTNGTKIADVYNDARMKLVLPFNQRDAASVSVGSVAEVSVAGSMGTVNGKVTGKSSSASATSYHASIVYVTVELANPGALTEEDSGSAVINGVACADSAHFEYISSHAIIAEVSGTVNRVNVVIGDSVSNGTQLAYINSTQAQNSLKNAQLSLEDSNIQLEKAEEAVKDYLIEAPIDGTVVTKNAKAGDTVDASNNQTALCVIYDLSSVKFSIDVDETEIALVKTGQKVKITADAVKGEFEGTITKVPVDGVNQNGVTTYTVEVEIKEYGDLLPGMNIDAEVTVEEAQDVLAVPVNSVNRGNIVFVKDDGKKRENDITDMINGKKQSETDSENSKSEKADEKKQKKKKDADKMPPDGMPMPMPSGAPSGGVSMDNIPMNIEIPEGYRAIKVETGINDTEYIEIKSGLSEGDMVRALDTESSSAGASFGNGGAAMGQMGGMSGGMGGGMPGGGMPSGGGRAGGGMPGGGMR